MTFTEADIDQCLRVAFPNDTIAVTGDGRHFQAHIVSARFEGLAPLARHRLVYAALGDHMKEDIHALSINASTPTE